MSTGCASLSPMTPGWRCDQPPLWAGRRFWACAAPAGIEGVRLLLEAGANPSRPLQADLLGASREGDPPISPVAAAIECSCSAELIELLLRYGGDPNAPGRDGSSPVHLAMRQGRTEV